MPSKAAQTNDFNYAIKSWVDRSTKRLGANKSAADFWVTIFNNLFPNLKNFVDDKDVDSDNDNVDDDDVDDDRVH